jgi:hypothetical protein
MTPKTFFRWLVALVLCVRCEAMAQAIVDLPPEQRAQIKEYIFKEKIPPALIGEQIRKGVLLPTGVELRTVPSDWRLTLQPYLYFYATTASIS